MVRTAFAESDRDVARCHLVMAELRPHVDRESFARRVRRQRADGYRLLYLEVDGEVRSVAGFRVTECLAWGRFLYVDDLVTRETDRGRGYGRSLLERLRETARAEGCRELHLDSAVHRVDAHRFYGREGLTTVGYHFSVPIEGAIEG
jgi:GNAT superfamily N-acetyltransferase